MDIERLRRALQKSWSKDTCYPLMKDRWSTDNPAYGQCYATALIVNDHLGGEILKARFPDRTAHFWNRIDGKEIDLTKSQFRDGEKMPKPKVVSREMLMKDPKNKEHNKRYLLLKRRIEQKNR